VEKVDASQATSDLSTQYDHYCIGAKAWTTLNCLEVLQILEEKYRLLFAKSSRENGSTGRYRKNVSAVDTPPRDLIMLTI
jgi:GDP-D-mannose dehydratase